MDNNNRHPRPPRPPRESREWVWSDTHETNATQQRELNDYAATQYLHVSSPTANKPSQQGFPVQSPQIFDYGIQQPDYSQNTPLVYNNGPVARDTHLTPGQIYWDTSSSSPSTIPESFFDDSSGVAYTPLISEVAEEPGPGGAPSSGFSFEQAPYGNTPGVMESGLGGDLLGTPNRADEINAMDGVLHGPDPLSNLPTDAVPSRDLFGFSPWSLPGLGLPESQASFHGHYNIGEILGSNYDASAQYNSQSLNEPEFGVVSPNRRSNLDNIQVNRRDRASYSNHYPASMGTEEMGTQRSMKDPQAPPGGGQKVRACSMMERIYPLCVKRDYASEFARRHRGAFTIPLTAGFGPDIRIRGVPFAASQENVRIARRLKPAYPGAESVVVSWEEMLPILPVGGTKDIVFNIGKVLGDIVRLPGLLGSWVSTVRENTVIPEASCQILRVACNYYQNCGVRPSNVPEPFGPVSCSKQQPDDILRCATKMAILSTMMSTCLSIPNHGLKELQKRFRDKTRTKWMVPRVVNKIVKYSVCCNLISFTKKVLRGLDKLLREKKKKIRTGHVVYIVIMLAISIGTAQMSLVDICHMTIQQGADVVVGRQVMSELKELENVYSKLRCIFHRTCQVEEILEPDKFSKLDDNTKILVEELSEVSMFNGEIGIQFHHP
ncbi:hypothetical protein FQN50_009418 [Emmonsiellopsis sp. PD_5]|nr:hypothetical protein FQN50_009418 [Emmonsiellopsis sp. PD_5]